MSCEVEFTNEFEEWWDDLSEEEQDSVDSYVVALIDAGTSLRYPYSSGIKGSKHSHMRELRIQHKGQPYRVFYAFDPRRTAILLIGGKKGSGKQWYRRFVPMADALYDEHLETLRWEGRS